MSLKRDASFTDAEDESLPIHVHACAERYTSIFHRLSRIERVLYAVALGVGSLVVTVAGSVLIAIINRGLTP